MKSFWLSGMVSLALVSCTPSTTDTTVTTPPTNVDATLTSAPKDWKKSTHIHSIAVNPDNPKILYLATHHGLLQRSESGEWLQVGTNRSDFMSFVAHPTDSSRFYASGHPPTGGNLGFIVSDNQGQDWQLQSMEGVDFHALAIAPGDPDTIYGLATSGKQGLFVTSDSGETWNQLKANGLAAMPFSLVVDPRNPRHVFAPTRSGLYETIDGGNNWTVIPNTEKVPVVGLEIVQEGDESVMYGYRLDSEAPGIFRSTDSGRTWEAVGTGTNGVILYLASVSSNPQILYAANDKNTIFQTLDRGETWQELN